MEVALRERTCFRGHSGGIIAVGFLPDAGLVVSGSDDGTLRVWEDQTATEMSRVDIGSPHAIEFSDDSKYAIVVYNVNEIAVWDVQRSVRVSTFSVPDLTRVRSLRISSDFKYAIFGGQGRDQRGIVVLVNLETMYVEHTFAEYWLIYSAALARDTMVAFGGNLRGDIFAWDVKTGTLLQESNDRILAASESMMLGLGGRILLIVGGRQSRTGGALCLLDPTTLVVKQVLSTDDYLVTCATSTNGDMAVTGSSQPPLVQLWDLQNPQWLADYSGHESTVAAIALDQAQSKVLSGSYDKTVRLLDIVRQS